MNLRKRLAEKKRKTKVLHTDIDESLMELVEEKKDRLSKKLKTKVFMTDIVEGLLWDWVKK